MKKYQENGAVIVLVTAAACILFMFSGGIRTNFGIIVQTLSDRTGVSYADVSFAIALGQLVYGVSQPFFGILALKRSNGFVLSLGTLLMAAGLLLTAQVTSAPALVVTLGLLFSAGTGAFISSWLGGIFITNSGNYQAIWLFDIVLCTIRGKLLHP